MAAKIDFCQSVRSAAESMHAFTGVVEHHACAGVESMHAFTGVVEHHACAGVYVRQML